jgi:hypothetical protein
MTEQSIYRDSIVVFLDILGLTEAIRDEVKVQSIAEMLAATQGMAKVINERSKENWRIDPTAHAFSDTIVISCPGITKEAFIRMAHIVAQFQFSVMRRGFFLRGGMSAGGHYEEEGVAFGPAYLKAYEMEKVAIWPRVLVDPDVLGRLDQGAVHAALKSYVSRDEGGLCYFNYLHLLIVQQMFQSEQDAKDGLYRVDLTEKLSRHKEYLLEAVDKLRQTHRFDLLSRYHAVANYHNRYVKGLYENLPTTKSWREVNRDTPTGQIIDNIKTLGSSQQEVTEHDMESLLDFIVSTLYADRNRVRQCEIDLGAVFGPFYPHDVGK